MQMQDIGESENGSIGITTNNSVLQQQSCSRISPIPLRINAENMNPRKYIMIVLIYVSFFVSLHIIKYTLSDLNIITKTNETQLKSAVNNQCKNPSGFMDQTLICQNFSSINPKIGLIMRGLTPLHQYSLIQIQGKEKIIEQINNTQAKITLYSLDFQIKQQIDGHKYGYFKEKNIISMKTVNLTITSYLAIYRHFSQQNYLLVIEILDTDKISTDIETPQLKAILLNPKLTLTQMIFRGCLFILTMVSSIIFTWKYIKQQKHKRMFQQKLVICLSISTLFFNNPLYSLTIMKNSLFWLLIDVLMIAQGFCFWMLFIAYICLRNIYTPNFATQYKMPLSKKVIFIVYGLVFFALLIFLYYSFAASSTEKSQFFFERYQSPLWLVYIITILLILWILYILILAQQAIKIGNICTSPQLMVLILCIIIAFTLSDVFGSANSKYSPQSPIVQILIIRLIFNFNCLLVQYLFTGYQVSGIGLLLNSETLKSNMKSFIKVDSQQYNQNDDGVQIGQISIINNTRL